MHNNQNNIFQPLLYTSLHHAFALGITIREKITRKLFNTTYSLQGLRSTVNKQYEITDCNQFLLPVSGR